MSEKIIVTTSEGEQVDITRFIKDGMSKIEIPLIEILHWEYSPILKKEIPIHKRDVFCKYVFVSYIDHEKRSEVIEWKLEGKKE